MTRMCMFKFLKGHIEYLAQHLLLEMYGSTADSRSANKELIVKVQQAMSQLDAYEKLRQIECEFTEMKLSQRISARSLNLAKCF